MKKIWKKLLFIIAIIIIIIAIILSFGGASFLIMLIPSMTAIFTTVAAWGPLGILIAGIGLAALISPDAVKKTADRVGDGVKPIIDKAGELLGGGVKAFAMPLLLIFGAYMLLRSPGSSSSRDDEVDKEPKQIAGDGDDGDGSTTSTTGVNSEMSAPVAT